MSDDTLRADAEKSGIMTAVYTDFLGHEHTRTIRVESKDLGANRYLAVDNGEASKDFWSKQCNTILDDPMKAGRSYTIRAHI